ncbi:hypothetical protein F5Y16DRAFT_161540 [Xylariaceae sp. FL0255]|nr:hypothetical protein F5Y16DRAFT_161540 [Xylariaceae sp. FL0255]
MLVSPGFSAPGHDDMHYLASMVPYFQPYLPLPVWLLPGALSLAVINPVLTIICLIPQKVPDTTGTARRRSPSPLAPKAQTMGDPWTTAAAFVLIVNQQHMPADPVRVAGYGPRMVHEPLRFNPAMNPAISSRPARIMLLLVLFADFCLMFSRV